MDREACHRYKAAAEKWTTFRSVHDLQHTSVRHEKMPLGRKITRKCSRAFSLPPVQIKSIFPGLQIGVQYASSMVSISGPYSKRSARLYAAWCQGKWLISPASAGSIHGPNGLSPSDCRGLFTSLASLSLSSRVTPLFIVRDIG
jgi:hypothetical protein